MNQMFHKMVSSNFPFNFLCVQMFTLGFLFFIFLKKIANIADADKPATYSFFSIEYYQQFFNVDTSIVSERIISSMIPRRAPPSYLKQNIGLNPDLYGPFWIVTTLVLDDSLLYSLSEFLFLYFYFDCRSFALQSVVTLQIICNKQASPIIGVTIFI